MTATHRATTWLLICAVAFGPISAGCRSMQPVSVQTTPAQPATWSVAAGDHLRLTLVDARTVRLTVKSVTPDAVVAASGVRYPFAGIRAVERRQFSGRRTLLLAVGAVLLVRIVYMAAWVAAMPAI